MSPSASSRALLVGAETAFTILARARELEAQGRKVIHLELGEPDFDTPEHIKQAAIEALLRGETHYTPTPGIPELRQAIASTVKRDLKIDVSWRDNVLVTVGGKEAILVGLAAILEPGDEVIVPDPGYPAYEGGVAFLGGRPVPLQLKEENGFRTLPDDVTGLISAKTKAVVLNSPSNPTGSIVEEDDAKALAEIARDNDLFVLSDEVYRRIIYDGARHCSPAQFGSGLENTIVVDGFSKTFAMTGWRLGYLILPSRLQEAAAKILNIMSSCVSPFVQRAGIAALEGPAEPVNEMVSAYRQRRDALIEEVSRIPEASMVRPRGAFYGFINLKHYLDQANMDCQTFASKLLEERGVALLHGTAMGRYGEGYVRISYANSIPNIRGGVQELGKALQQLST